eukprot:Colp12_sorted_trinity150504_noHs@14381
MQSLRSKSSDKRAASGSIGSFEENGDIERLSAATEMFGPSPGAKKMLKAGLDAARQAISTGLYIVWRNTVGTAPQTEECARVGPSSRCFCDHAFSVHDSTKKVIPCTTQGCDCKRFLYIPSRPEEIGEWWLPRRRGFNVHTWRASCRCKHSHAQHNIKFARRCKVPGCPCGAFSSAFTCLTCSEHWEDHDTVIETEKERRMAGRSIGEAFIPLSGTPKLQELVFGEQLTAEFDAPHTHKTEEELANLYKANSRDSVRLRPPNPMHRPERSILLMQGQAAASS